MVIEGGPAHNANGGRAGEPRGGRSPFRQTRPSELMALPGWTLGFAASKVHFSVEINALLRRYWYDIRSVSARYPSDPCVIPTLYSSSRLSKWGVRNLAGFTVVAFYGDGSLRHRYEQGIERVL